MSCRAWLLILIGELQGVEKPGPGRPEVSSIRLHSTGKQPCQRISTLKPAENWGHIQLPLSRPTDSCGLLPFTPGPISSLVHDIEPTDTSIRPGFRSGRFIPYPGYRSPEPCPGPRVGGYWNSGVLSLARIEGNWRGKVFSFSCLYPLEDSATTRTTSDPSSTKLKRGFVSIATVASMCRDTGQLTV